MRKLFTRIKQALCLHWFDPVRTDEYSEHVGHFICHQQRLYEYTEETRTCSRCGLTDKRRVGEPRFIGWD